MKQTQEFDGKNVDSAVEKACLSLNISKKNLVYDVISSGSTGIFGIVGVKKAKIRVTLPEKSEAFSSQSSYESDRAGVMSIVDEAFGKEAPQPAAPVTSAKSSSEKSSYENKDSDSSTASDISTDTSADDSKASDDEKQPEAKNQPERKKQPDRPANPRSKRGRTFNRKPSNAKTNGEKGISDEAAASEKIEADESVPETAANEKTASKKQPRGKAGDKKSDSVKPYSRKTRTKKRDTWRPDGDDALNEAMAAMDADDAADNGTQIAKKEANKKTKYAKSSISNENVNSDKYDDEDSIELDDEFMNEDFHGSDKDYADVDDDEPYTKDDEDAVEAFDERDDGYPPKYKGEIPVDVSEEAMRIGRETLQKMVSLITDDAIVTAQSDEDRLLLKVEGGNSGVLIGRRGQTLEAMQYLTDKIINRYSESRVRLKVDIEGYMETRKANLKTLAYKMADKAKKTGKPATINQMTAQDRRIIHLALKDDSRVRTQSMGEGYYRRLVIFPKKSSFKRRKPFKK